MVGGGAVGGGEAINESRLGWSSRRDGRPGAEQIGDELVLGRKVGEARVERSPLEKASATTRPEVAPQSAPADRGAAATDVVVVVLDTVCGEKAANPAIASSAMVSQSANAAKRAKRIVFSAFWSSRADPART